MYTNDDTLHARVPSLLSGQHFTRNTSSMFKRKAPNEQEAWAYDTSSSSCWSHSNTSFLHNKDDECSHCLFAPTTSRPSRNQQEEYTSVVDKEIARELNQLSIHDRQKVYEDIHGVSDVVQETPELVASSIEEMMTCVQRIRKRGAFEKAIFLSPSYVKDPAFCLQFLRAENFHARNAAKRMVAYFELRYELFGLEALVRDLTMEEDLEEGAVTLLKSGLNQALPSKDSAGRTVVMVFFKQVCNDYPPHQITQAAMYAMEKINLTNPTPEKGLVMIIYESVESGAVPSFLLEGAKEATRYFACMPLNIKAWHVCYSDPRSAPMVELFKVAMGRSGRVRVRSFFGKDLECRYHLMSFGIPTNEIPVSHDGKQDFGPYVRFLEKQRQLETFQVQNRRQNGPPCPTSIDVVFGKGQPFQQHVGNQRMHEVVAKYFHLYPGLSRSQARQLFLKVTTELKQSGTRFLRKNDEQDDGWVEVDEKDAHKKIAGAFRNKALQLSKNNGGGGGEPRQ